MVVETANKILSIGIIGLQVFIVFLVVYLLFLRKKNRFIYDFLGKNAIILAFLVSLMATSGSLFYSLYAGFIPCELCWYQRIFMYPLAILFGLALIKKDNNIIDYTLALSSVGALISLYHNYIYYQKTASTFCVLGESCIVKYVFEFGYITIPMMALTAFSSIIIFCLIKRTAIDKGFWFATMIIERYSSFEQRKIWEPSFRKPRTTWKSTQNQTIPNTTPYISL